MVKGKSENSKMRKTSILDQWQLWLLASLTLGLAPFTPEPHIWGKLKWVWGGANGMQMMDYWDLIMHGTPWVFLIISFIRLAVKNRT